MKLSRIDIKTFQDKILNWYEINGRIYPWRITKDPYRILVSEFLLQKTHVRKVEEVYTQFIEEYPSVEHLAKAEKSKVLAIIKPLGFLYRAERMILTSNIITNNYNGNVPNNFEDLLSLTGVGRYIATAVLVFSFEQRFVVVDTNVIKVLQKELGYSSIKKRPRTDIDLWGFAQSLAPLSRIREFNWGLLDYGATI